MRKVLYIILIVFIISCDNQQDLDDQPQQEIEKPQQQELEEPIQQQEPEDPHITLNFLGYKKQALSPKVTLRYKNEIIENYENIENGSLSILEESLNLYDFYQIDVELEGYRSRTLTFMAHEITSLIGADIIIPMLRSDSSVILDDTINYNEVESYIYHTNWLDDKFDTYEILISDESKELYSSSQIDWGITTLNGNDLTIDNNGLISMPNNSSGLYIISINNKTDIALIIDEVKHNTSFNKYIDQFQEEARKIRGESFTADNLIITFGIGNTLSTGTNGRAINFNGKGGLYNVVLINKDHWDGSSEHERELLIFHELGHNILGRVAHETTFINKYPISIMCFPKPMDGMYSDNRDFYMKELFTPLDTPEYTEVYNNFVSHLGSYQSTKLDLMITRIIPYNKKGLIGFRISYRNRYHKGDDRVRHTTYEINGNSVTQGITSLKSSIFGGAYNFFIYPYQDFYSDFTKGEPLNVTITVDSREIYDDIDRSNNTKTFTYIWPGLDN